MIDLFTLALTHVLIATAIIRLLLRDDLDGAEADGGPRARRRKGRGRPGA